MYTPDNLQCFQLSDYNNMRNIVPMDPGSYVIRIDLFLFGEWASPGTDPGKRGRHFVPTPCLIGFASSGRGHRRPLLFENHRVDSTRVVDGFAGSFPLRNLYTLSGGVQVRGRSLSVQRRSMFWLGLEHAVESEVGVQIFTIPKHLLAMPRLSLFNQL